MNTENSQSKELVNLDDLLLGLAKEATAVERPSVSTIGLRAGQLSYNKQPVAGNKLDCIVIASTHANLYYEGAYDPDNLANPVCYSYSQDGVGMKPHPASSKPQAEICDECPHNKWGSAEKGKGKACKNVRHLALIPATTKAEEVATAELAVIKLPVTSVKNWANYVNKIATLFSRPPLGVVTTIGTQPDAKSQFQVIFNQVQPVENEMLKPLIDRMGSARGILERVYEANDESEDDGTDSVQQGPANGKKKKY